MSSKKPAIKKPARSQIPATTEVLLEIGTEELPYQFVGPALRTLQHAAETLLKDLRLTARLHPYDGHSATVGAVDRRPCEATSLRCERGHGAIQGGGVRPSRPTHEGGDRLCRWPGHCGGPTAGAADPEGRISLRGEAREGAAGDHGVDASPAAASRQTVISEGHALEPDRRSLRQTCALVGGVMWRQSASDSVRHHQGRQPSQGHRVFGAKAVQLEGLCGEVDRAVFQRDGTPWCDCGSGPAACHDPRAAGLARQVRRAAICIRTTICSNRPSTWSSTPIRSWVRSNRIISLFRKKS